MGPTGATGPAPDTTKFVTTDGAQTITGKKTFTGGQDFGGRTLENVGNPGSPGDAATKQYVDTRTTPKQYSKGVYKAYKAGESSPVSDVMCPDGQIATGGGGRVLDDNMNTVPGASIIYSSPYPNSNGAVATGWRVVAVFSKDTTGSVWVDANVMCIAQKI